MILRSSNIQFSSEHFVLLSAVFPQENYGKKALFSKSGDAAAIRAMLEASVFIRT
jgi:hypothetical protein